MDAQLHPRDDDVSPSRDQLVVDERMETEELAYRQTLPSALDSEKEDGEIHSDQEVLSAAIFLEVLQSAIEEVVAGGAGNDVQAPQVAIEPTHAPKPLVAEDAQEKGQSGATETLLNNFLSVDGKGQVLLDESVELGVTEFPQ